MKYISVFKRSEVLIHTKTWMHLGNIVLCENRQATKGRYCVVRFVWGRYLGWVESWRQIVEWRLPEVGRGGNGEVGGVP